MKTLRKHTVKKTKKENRRKMERSHKKVLIFSTKNMSITKFFLLMY